MARGRKGYDDDTAKEIIHELNTTFKSFKDIAEEVGVSVSLITKINNGEVQKYHKFYDGTFPIRLTTKERNEVIYRLYKKNKSIEEIMEMFNVSFSNATVIISRKMKKEKDEE